MSRNNFNFLSFTTTEMDEEMLKQWNGRRQCKRCSVFYSEKDNIGQWRCSQHAGFFNPTCKGSKAVCCGKVFRGFENTVSATPWGCVRADHTILDIPWNDSHKLYISRKTLEVMMPPKDYTASDEKFKDGIKYIGVQRYDWKESEKIQSGRKIDYIEGTQIWN